MVKDNRAQAIDRTIIEMEKVLEKYKYRQDLKEVYEKLIKLKNKRNL